MCAEIPIFLVVGAPAVGKSSTGRALAARFPKSIYIPVDDVRRMVVSGVVHPSENWSPELVEQLRLARQSVSQMAVNYADAGFAVVIDDFWDPYSQLQEYQRLWQDRQVQRVLLYPERKTALERNFQRSGTGESNEYIAGGVHLVYSHLETVVANLEKDGWHVLDSTVLSVDATVDRILDRAGIR